MKTLKKLTAMLLALTIALSICACSSQSNKSYVSTSPTPRPFTTDHVKALVAGKIDEYVNAHYCSDHTFSYTTDSGLRTFLPTIVYGKIFVKTIATSKLVDILNYSAHVPESCEEYTMDPFWYTSRHFSDITLTVE